MITLILLFILLVCVVLTIYPYVIYPMILQRLPEEPFDPADEANNLTFAVLFCAHNEEAALPETIANLRRVKERWPELRIYAYSDNSSDRTFALLEEASDIITAFEGKTRAGKPAGMRTLVDASREDVLIFMDANVLIVPDTARNFEAYFAHPDIGVVACTLHYVNENESAAAHVGGLYWRLEERIKRLESETGSTMGADGSLFAVRRELYPPVRPDLQDDFLASMQAVFAGQRCVSAPDIMAYERATVQSADEFRRKRRIACGAFSTHRAMAPQLAQLAPLDRFKYVSHKLVRWFGAYFIALGGLTALCLAALWGVFLPFVALLLLGGLLSAALVFVDFPPARKVYEIGAAMLATAIGVMESVTGTRYVTWTPVER